MSYTTTCVGGFPSHATSETWWQERAAWFAAVGMEKPVGWSSMTLAEKHEAAVRHVHERDRIAKITP